jgi:hypothetical protein
VIENSEVKKIDLMKLAIKKDYLLEKQKEVESGFKRAEGHFMSVKQRMGEVKEERLTLFLNYNHSWPLEIKRAFKL